MPADVCQRQQDGWERGGGDVLFLIPRGHTPRWVIENYTLPHYRPESEAILTPLELAVSSRPWIAVRQGCDLMNHPKVVQKG